MFVSRRIGVMARLKRGTVTSEPAVVIAHLTLKTDKVDFRSPQLIFRSKY
jgi:hypothetical protein